MQRCWDKDPPKRPTFGELIEEFLELLSDLIWIEPGKASLASEAIANRDADMMALVDGLSKSSRHKISVEEKKKIATQKKGKTKSNDDDGSKVHGGSRGPVDRKTSLISRRTSQGHALIKRNSASIVLKTEEGNQLTTEQVVALKALFHDIDHDKNGFISREEAGELFDEATSGDSDSYLDDWKADAMIQALDTNNDGKVSMDEWIVYCANLNWMGMLDPFVLQMENSLRKRNRLTERTEADFKSMETIIVSARDVVAEKKAIGSTTSVNPAEKDAGTGKGDDEVRNVEAT